MLHVSDDTLVVQHDDLKNRVVPGVERYRLTDDLGVDVGDDVDLWVTDQRAHRARTAGPGAEPPKEFPLTGTVVNVDGVRVMVDHEPIEGLMGGMVMGFGLSPWEAKELATGDRVSGVLLTSDYGYQLVDVQKTGRVSVAMRDDVAPLKVGEMLPALSMVDQDGRALLIGEGQGRPTVVTFIYTRCPDPDFCPAIGARMAALQNEIGSARIVAVTLDPDNDRPPVLKAWGSVMGADFERWMLARAEPVVLQELALRAGQHVSVNSGKISHLHRTLVLDSSGRMTRRFDDLLFTSDQVVQALKL